MKLTKQKNNRFSFKQWSRGFSLPELAIAIGIAGVALMSTVGLMPSLMDSERDSGLKSAMPQLTSQVIGELRSANFPTSFPVVQERLFTASCEPTTATAVGEAAPIYRCDVVITQVPSTAALPTQSGGVPSVGNNSCLVRLDFTYYAEARIAPTTSAIQPDPNAKIVYATLSL